MLHNSIIIFNNYKHSIIDSYVKKDTPVQS